MAKEYPGIVPSLREFIDSQLVFFVATAPTDDAQSVNVSPKGLDTFRVLSPTEVVYQDHTGSGSETAAHLLQSSRITVMFCSFGKKPLILRLYGEGRVFPADSIDGQQFGTLFPDATGVRGYVLIDVKRVRTSCGFGVPLASDLAPRGALEKWESRVGEEGLVRYRVDWNECSIDGFPTR